MSLDTERNTEAEQAKLDRQVHLRHCNQGDYKDSCKYGEFDTCPALRTYIDEVREELAKHLKVGKGLMRVYTLLVLVKGEHTTPQDVHDAWAVNINEAFPEHYSLIPFDQLKPETQAKDNGHVDAIHKTAHIIKERWGKI